MASLRWHINVKLTGFTVLLLPILIALGFWQLQRAQEKLTILEEYAQQQSGEIVNLNTDFSSLSAQTGHIVAYGYFDEERYWLVEGKVLNGQLGYHVIMPFYITTDDKKNAIVLINRGWVKANKNRNILPVITTPSGKVMITGHQVNVYDAPLTQELENNFIHWPHKILEIDFQILSQQLQREVVPVLILLSEENEYAFIVQDTRINMPPEKHKAYAFQWFSLAFALIVLWFVASTNIWTLIKK